MLISESFMSKFGCHPMHIKAHSRYHTMHLGSREGTMRVMVGRVYTSALRDDVHAAREQQGARDCACSIVRDQWARM